MTKQVNQNDIRRMKQEDSHYGERMKQTAKKLAVRVKNPQNFTRMSMRDLMNLEES